MKPNLGLYSQITLEFNFFIKVKYKPDTVEKFTYKSKNYKRKDIYFILARNLPVKAKVTVGKISREQKNFPDNMIK